MKVTKLLKTYKYSRHRFFLKHLKYIANQMFHYLQICKLYLCVFSIKTKERKKKGEKEEREREREEERKEGRKEGKEVHFLYTPNLTIKFRTLIYIH